jgi:hypothetical protein
MNELSFYEGYLEGKRRQDETARSAVRSMIGKKPFETADGKKHATLAKAAQHAMKWTSDDHPEHIWVGGNVRHRVYHNGAIEDVGV